MKLLIPQWGAYNLDEIINIFKEKHTVVPYRKLPRNYHYDPVFRKDFTDTLTELNIEGVFSLQYFPIISNICEKIHIPYICWCYNDQINGLLLTESIFNDCNIIFLTDSQWVEKLQRLGIEATFYLPWAASCKSISLRQTKTDSFASQTDIALIDTVNTEAWMQYLTLISKIDKRTRGFFDGLLQAQQNIYGYNLIANAMNETVLAAIQNALPLSGVKNSIASPEESYAFSVFYPAITKKETQCILQILEKEKKWKTTFYTSDANEQHLHITQKKIPVDNEELLTVYFGSKVNILPAPREIQNGIPVQAMDIMGCGGFLLTNFQNDYLEFFEPDKDYVYYESPEDMIQKVHYYLKHEDKRKNIENSAFNKISRSHSIEHRIHEMLALLGI